MTAIQNRYEFVYLFDVENGNPNGDPDAGNLPRIDPETHQGLVTDVCLKRKVRNFVEIVKEGQSPYEIYVRERAVLNQAHERAHQAVGVKADSDEGGKKKRKGKGDEVEKARWWMCENFFDVRTFGAVMTLGTNCGQVRGPIQMAFARSVEPILSMEVSITRMAVATEREAEAQGGDNRTMGRKSIVPYGLYRSEGFISAHLAGQTGFSEADLELFWSALTNMFDHDRSAARGKMAPRKLVVFKHDSKLGNAPAHSLFDRVTVSRASDPATPARAFSDYQVAINSEDLPSGVEIVPKF
jgi:CRISPR-associated protein Csd2